MATPGVLPSSIPNPLSYRREVDGLRAIAVLSVILFHAGASWCSGGFVGVDVFFVISGYLITSIILSELESGTFTVIGFYERRARRILPALFFVLCSVVPIAYFTLFPDQMARFAKSLLSSLLFVSNYYFRMNTGYFAPDAEEEPLLHLWSLAVEEQYYIFFPLLALLLWNRKEWMLKVATVIWRHKSYGFVALVTIIAILSFRYAERNIESDVLFYDTRGRVWELLIGSLSAIYLRGRQREPNRIMSEIASILGFVLIFAAILGLSRKNPFPSHWALLPTLGAALIILFASPSTLVGRLLSTRPMVGIGLISYSAYLWHWPLFVFARIAAPSTPSTPERLFFALSVLSLAMAWFSWRFVERPFRNRKLFLRRQVFRFAAVGALVLAVVGGIGYGGLSSRFRAEDADLLVSVNERSNYVFERYNKLGLGKIENFSSVGKLHVLLLGDSYSQDFFNMVAETDLLPDAEIIARYIHVRCQIYLGEENGLDFVAEANRQYCEKSVYNEKFYPELQSVIQKADIVIFSASWAEWSASRLPETIKNLHIPDTTRIIVLGGKNFGKIKRRNYVGLPRDEKIGLRNDIAEVYFKIAGILRENLKDMKNVEFIDWYELICDTEQRRCPVFTPEGLLISYDSGHLTQAGVAYLGSLLKQRPSFKASQ